VGIAEFVERRRMYIRDIVFAALRRYAHRGHTKALPQTHISFLTMTTR
jgi:hypothetical protein